MLDGELKKLGNDIKNALRQVQEIQGPLKDMNLPNGRFERDLTKDLKSTRPLGAIGSLTLSGSLGIAAHITKTNTPPLSSFDGDPNQKELAYSSIEVQATAGAKLGGSLPAGQTVIGYGVESNAKVKWAQHLRFSQQGSAFQAFSDLAEGLRNPYEPTDVVQLRDYEVSQVEYSGSAGLRADAGWNYGLFREIPLDGGNLGDLQPKQPIGVSVGVKAGITVTVGIQGNLRIVVQKSPRGAGWLRVKLQKKSEDFVGAGLTLQTAASLTQVDEWAAAYVKKVLDPSAATEASVAYQQALKIIKDKVADQALTGLRAEFKAAINRTHSTDSLLDLDLQVAICPETYRKALLGEFTEALEKARAGGAQGVELNACSLKDTVRKDRVLSLHLNLFGFNLARDLKSWNEKTVQQDTSGAIWLSGQAGASLVQKFQKDLEGISFLFDLHAIASNSGSSRNAALEGYSATLNRTMTLSSDDDINEVMPQHVRGAVLLGLVPDEQARQIQANLANQPGAYTFSLSLQCPEQAVRRLFLLDAPGADSKYYESSLWNHLQQAAERLDVPIPSTHSNRPCLMSSLINPVNIHTIKVHPDMGTSPDQWNNVALPKGCNLASPGLVLFWGYMAQAYLLIEQLGIVRDAVLRNVSYDQVAKELVRLTRSMNNQIGALHGQSFEAKFLLPALMAGPEFSEIHSTFKRGSIEIAI